MNATSDAPDQASTDPQKTVGEHEYEISKLRTEIGWIGKVFGAADEKPGNIAGIVIVFAAFGLIAIYFIPSPEQPQGLAKQTDLAIHISTALISIITLALGYLFGKKS